jgi:predicted NAD/FAD-binding protein
MCPRKKFYDAHRTEVLEKQRTRRRLEKEKVARFLAELERLERLQQQKSDLESLESQTVKRIIKKEIHGNPEDPEKEPEGANPWQ